MMSTRRADTAQPIEPMVRDWIVAAVLAAIALAGAWIYRDFAQDDAFITYRYAKNIANGYGFVYNRGENVLGTTTPLYTLMLALLIKLFRQDVRVLGHLLSMLCLWLSSVVLYDLGKERGAFLAAAIAVVFISNALLISAVGMESFFLLALLLLTLRSYVRDNLYLTGALLGLLLLTRYETILFAGLLAFHFVVRRRQLPIWLLPTAVLFIPWMAFAWYAFGHVIPQSALAKFTDQMAGHGYPFAIGAVIWWAVYGSETAWHYSLFPLVLLGGYSAFRNKIHHQAYLLILAWSVIYFVSASLIALSFPWYYAPLIPGFSIMLVWGAEFVAGFLSTVLALIPSGRLSVRALRNGFLATMILGVVVLQLSAWKSDWVYYRGKVMDRRYVHYREVAEWLKRHAKEGETLAADEIGILGYYSDLRIVDLHGLVTPELSPWLPRGRAQLLARAIELFAPDYLFNNAAAGYEPIQSFDFDNEIKTLYGRSGSD